ncbi:MAG: PorT family protein [Cyclobacteriaceae bacterium]|nr:PorT family protein [Cyclobacteriaceae bacterium]
MNTKSKNNLWMSLGFAYLLLLLGGPAKAQSKSEFGIKGGLNLSNFYVEKIDDKDARLGFNAGLYSRAYITEFFAIQPELNYSTRGTEIISDGFFNQRTKFNLNYLDIPVLAVFKLGKTVELQAGVYGGYLLNANIKSEGDLGNWFDDLDRDNFQTLDYGLTGGLGFNLGGVQLGARYNLGLQQVAKSNGARNVLGDSKNSLAQLYIAFPLSSK